MPTDAKLPPRANLSTEQKCRLSTLQQIICLKWPKSNISQQFFLRPLVALGLCMCHSAFGGPTGMPVALGAHVLTGPPKAQGEC